MEELMKGLKSAQSETDYLKLITPKNYILLKEYMTRRRARLDSYKDLRTKEKFKNWTDKQFDDFFNEAVYDFDIF